MGRQRYTAERNIAKLREVDVIVGRGGTTVEACRQIGIAEQTLYRWRKECKVFSPPLFPRESMRISESDGLLKDRITGDR